MLRRHNVFDEMFDIFRDFDNLYRRALGQYRELPGEVTGMRSLLPTTALRGEFFPAVECYTKDKQLILRAELPGVDPKDVDVSVVGDQLILKGEKKEEAKVDEKDLFFQEISRGRFERTFPLPEGIKKEQVKATFTNGVLEVVLPALAIEAARKVPIEVMEGKKAIKAA